MIPENIEKEDIEQAIQKIDVEGVPSGAQSSTHDLLFQDKRYPPKLVLSLANYYANGTELDRSTFEGGVDTECFRILQSEGFEITKKPGEEETQSSEGAECWFVGASYGASDDKTEEFVNAGIWSNGYADKLLEEVNSIKPGSKIAIKSSYTRKNELPFDAHGGTVSVMAIKATGVVKENKGDGRTLIVDWEPLKEKREWYFYTGRSTVWKVVPDSPYAEALIAFTFEGKDQDYDFFMNSPYWKDKYAISSEVKDVMRYETSKPLNQILYGPPGTGKTYNTVNRALGILDEDFLLANVNDRDALKHRFEEYAEADRVFFVTFHQSFSYEDFVEGIRAVSDGEQVSYPVEPGIFKKACDAAAGSIGPNNIDEQLTSFTEEVAENEKRLKTRTGKDFTVSYRGGITFTCVPDASKEKRELPANIEHVRQVMMGNRPNKIYCESYVNGIADHLNSQYPIEGGYLSQGQLFGKYRISSVTDELISIIKPNGSLVPFPRTFLDQLVRHVKNSEITIKDIENGEWSNKIETTMEKYIVNGYNNLIPKIVEYLVDQKASKKSNLVPKEEPIVLIIDEINRGNISSIFGELITLIEDGKRRGQPEKLSVVLPYSKDDFSVPNNLYLIGTMNTADRSLALLDTALRRRFDFVEMMPDPGSLNGLHVKGIDIKKMLEVINKRIEVLYDREHTIGHAFFIPLFNDTNEEDRFRSLQTIFSNKIVPLLEEYFFEDWEKIRLVLGDNNKPEDLQFVAIRSNSGTSELFGEIGEFEIDDEIQIYSRNIEAIKEPKAYKAIYEA